MLTRRKFLGMLAVLPAITALAGSGMRLPRKDEVQVETDYFASDTAWYLKTDQTHGLKSFYRTTAGTNAPLSEKSLEDMLEAMRYNMADYQRRPSKLIVPPSLVKRAHEVLEYANLGFFDRLLWRLAHL